MIGFETRIKLAKIPFHSARIPSFWINLFNKVKTGTSYFDCLVCRTQNGFVKRDPMIPAKPEHWMILSEEFGSVCSMFFSFQQATKQIPYASPLPIMRGESPWQKPCIPCRSKIALVLVAMDPSYLLSCISILRRQIGQRKAVTMVDDVMEAAKSIINIKLQTEISAAENRKSLKQVIQQSQKGIFWVCFILFDQYSFLTNKISLCDYWNQYFISYHKEQMNCEYHNLQIKYFCAAEACYYLPLCDQCCNEHKQAHNKLETIPLKKAYLMAESNIRRQQTQIERLIAPFKTRQLMGKQISKQKEDLQKQKQRLIKIITQKIDAEIRLLATSNETDLSREETNLKKSLQLKSQEIGTFGCPHFYKKASILRKALNYEMTNFLQEMMTRNNQNLMKVHNLLNNSNRFKIYQNIHHQILISPLELREKTQQKSKQVKRIMNESPLYFLIDENIGTTRFLYTLQAEQKKMFIYNIDQESWTTSHTSLEIPRQGTAVHDQKNNRYFWIGGVGSVEKNTRPNSESYNNWGRGSSGNYDQGSMQRSDRILVFQPQNKENQWKYVNCRLNVPRSSCQAVIVEDKNNSNNYGIVIAGGIGQNGQILKSSQFFDINHQMVYLFSDTNFGAFSGNLVSFNKSNVLRIGGLYKNKSDYSIVEVVQRLDCTDWFRFKLMPKWSYVQLVVPQFDRTQPANLFYANQAALQINPNQIFVFGGITSDRKGVVQSYIIGVQEFNVQSRGVNINASRLIGSQDQKKKQNIVKQLKFTVRWVNEKPLISGDDFGGQTASIWKGRLHILQNMSLNELAPYQKRLLQFNMHEWSQIQYVLPE